MLMRPTSVSRVIVLIGLFMGVCLSICLPHWSETVYGETATPAGANEAAEADKAIRRVPGDLHAVVVGVGKFLHYPNVVLKTVPNDAGGFADFLEKQTSLYQRINVSVLVNDQATRQAVTAGILKAVKDAGEQDTVILYFSGDSKTDRSASDVYFNTYDTDLARLPDTALNLSDGKLFQDLRALRALTIIDACLPSVKRLSAFSAPQRTAVVTATIPGEPAYEDAKLPTSVFTHHLLRGVTGAADFDKNGVVTLEEAFKFARDAMPGLSGGRSQTPQMENRVQGHFPLAVVQSSAPAASGGNK